MCHFPSIPSNLPSTWSSEEIVPYIHLGWEVFLQGLSSNFLFGWRQAHVGLLQYSRELSTSLPHRAPLFLWPSNQNFSTSFILFTSNFKLSHISSIKENWTRDNINREDQFLESVSWLNKIHGPSSFNKLCNNLKPGKRRCCLPHVSYSRLLSSRQLLPSLIFLLVWSWDDTYE